MFYNFAVILLKSEELKPILKHIFQLILFWFILFFIYRIVFYIGISSLLNDVSFSLIFQSFYKGLRLDLSMIGYLLLFPIILFFFYSLFQKKIILKIIDGLNYFLIILYSLTAIGEMCLYREWKAKLSMQALEHFLHPSEVFKTTSWGLTILFFSLSIIGSVLFIKIYSRKFSLKNNPPIDAKSFGKVRWKSFAFIAVGAILNFITLRGGIQQIPIQDGDAFFCTQPAVNDATVNPLWNISYNIIDYFNHFKENPYNYFDIKEANEMVGMLYKTDKDTTISFLKATRPNIVFIIMEGWSAYDIKSFGGDNFAPFMDSLSRQGIRFTKLYPAGYVSDQGIPAVLSSFPCNPHISVINQSSKSAKLPCINQDLEKEGYQSGFMFGGDLTYGNIKSYIYNKKFDVVKEEKDIDNSIPRGKLGVQDGDMEGQYLKLLNAAKPPFVYAWFTLSTHMPYDFPGEKKQLVVAENDYVNGISYADKAFQHFFEEAKKQAWYKNTLFVIVSDHSHGCQKQFSPYDCEYHRIPLVFFGDVIDSTYRGKEVSAVFSQLDITKTLLKQMKMDEEAKQYVWGKNMFNPSTKSFAFYCSNSGAGFINNEGFIGYQQSVKDLIFNSFGDKNSMADTLTRYGHAFQQSVFEDYRLK
jgi:phosphoglycerol transferase MdoB-like AlkP superfamily enzyme